MRIEIQNPERISMLKAVLFDLDETLIDRSAMLMKYLEESYIRLSPALKTISFETYRDRFIELDAYGYYPKEKVCQELIDEFKLSLEMTVMCQDFHSYYPLCATLYPGAEEVLNTLRGRGHLIGIITNGFSSSQRSKIERTGLAKLAHTIVISEEAGLAKPDPAIFELAMSQLSVRPDETIFVGDNPSTDIVGANSAGIMAVWYENHIPCPRKLFHLPRLCHPFHHGSFKFASFSSRPMIVRSEVIFTSPGAALPVVTGVFLWEPRRQRHHQSFRKRMEIGFVLTPYDRQFLLHFIVMGEFQLDGK